MASRAWSRRRPGVRVSPAVLLKIYIYGYLNRVQSSRRLEREAQRNVELMWLTGRLAPDFKTIADFRKDHGGAIRSVCREFVVLCRRLACSPTGSLPSTAASSRRSTTATRTSRPQAPGAHGAARAKHQPLSGRTRPRGPGPDGCLRRARFPGSRRSSPSLRSRWAPVADWTATAAMHREADLD